mgnify:CR=1 FL=1
MFFGIAAILLLLELSRRVVDNTFTLVVVGFLLYVYFGRYFPLEETLREIDAVTSEKVLEIAASIFKKGGMSLATLGPVTEKDLPLERLNG